MKLKRTTIIISIIFGLILIITTIFFIYKFRFQCISDNISNWSDFGTFYWGFLSFLVATLNLIVFIILTINISKIQEDWNSLNLSFEQKKVITEYRHKAIEELSRIANGYLTNIANHAFVNKITDLNFVYFETIKLDESLRSFSTIYSYFFKDLTEQIHEILDLIKKIKENINKRDEFDKNEFINDLQKYRQLTNLSVSNLQEHNITFLNS